MGEISVFMKNDNIVLLKIEPHLNAVKNISINNKEYKANDGSISKIRIKLKSPKMAEHNC